MNLFPGGPTPKPVPVRDRKQSRQRPEKPQGMHPAWVFGVLVLLLSLFLGQAAR